MEYHVFISYSHDDCDLIDSIETGLKNRGIKCFRDNSKIVISADWAEKVSKAIKDCEVVLFVWSKNSNKSDYVADEIYMAKEEGKKIVPFKIGEFTLSDNLRLQLVRYNRYEVQEADKGAVDVLVLKLASLLGIPNDDNEGMENEVHSVHDSNEAHMMYEFAKNYDDSHEWKLAAKYYQQAADKGSTEAMTRLGEMYDDGIGIEVNPNKAFGLLLKAAKRGNMKAAAALGYMYYEGKCVEKDDYQAYKWSKKSMDSGEPTGLTIMALMHAQGIGVPKDMNKAFGMLYKAIELGDKEAWGVMAMLHLNFLGCNGEGADETKAKECILKGVECESIGSIGLYALCLLRGLFFEKDENEAYHYAKISAEMGNPTGKALLGIIYAEGLAGKKKDMAEAIKMLSESVEQGCNVGILTLANLYYQGIGVPQDYLKTLEILEKGCRLNDCDSIVFAAQMYRNGDGIDVNYERARELFEKAAKLGDADAYAYLGNMYETGQGVDADMLKAVNMYKSAADQGSGIGLFLLGDALYNGRGMEEDKAAAMDYFAKASEKGNVEAKNQLALIYALGEVCDLDIKKAETLWLECAEEENADALRNLGMLYSEGEMFEGCGIELNLGKAKNYYQRAAELGSTDAMVRIAWLLLAEDNADENGDLVMKLFQTAADAGYHEGCYGKGYLYENGIGTVKSTWKALDWYSKAADMGNANAMNMAGVMYADSKNKFYDTKKAYEYFVKAADNGHVYGMFNLGCFTVDGLGCTANKSAGMEWIKKAADQGCKDAVDYLRQCGLLPPEIPKPPALTHPNGRQITSITVDGDGTSAIYIRVKMAEGWSFSNVGSITLTDTVTNVSAKAGYIPDTKSWSATFYEKWMKGVSAVGANSEHIFKVVAYDGNRREVDSVRILVTIYGNFHFFSAQEFKVVKYEVLW